MLALDELNPAQRAAVEHGQGPLLILAGAGSGKTRVIAYRVAELLRRGVDPERILALTFTNKAAAELRGRVESLVTRLFGDDAPDPGYGAGPRMPRWMGTFHSIGARLLRRMADRAGLPPDFVILDDDDALKLCKEVCKEAGVDETGLPPRALRGHIDRAKNQAILPEQYEGHDYITDLVARLYPMYQERLKQLGAVDFGDLLLWPVVLCDRDEELRDLLGRRFQHVLVDEFQDVNQVQYRLLRHLAAGGRNLVVVGDDDQAIYGWRGADVSLILEFERDWPDVRIVKLEENYRSSQLILDAAHAVVSRNRQRRDKRLFTQRSGGERIICHRALDERREALYVANTIQLLVNEEGYSPADCAVIYRTNAQSRVLEEALRACDIPYTIYGGARFYDRAEVKDILAYLRLCHNPADELALTRVINVPARGIGDKTVAKITARARLGGIPLWQAVQDAIEDDALLGSGPRKKLRAFVDLVERLRRAAGALPVSKLAHEILASTDYLDQFSEDDPEGQSRHDNVMELVGSIEDLEREADSQAAGALGQAAPDATAETGTRATLEQSLFAPDVVRPLTLGDYLMRVALVTGEDFGDAVRGVQLMTAHAAKGLEFKVVLVTGLEDGLFPSTRSMDVDDDGEAEDRRLTEERRLCYVAMTRARERLFLTHAETRRIYGRETRSGAPSRFLHDIPPDCLESTREYDAPSRTTPRRPLQPSARFGGPGRFGPLGGAGDGWSFDDVEGDAGEPRRTRGADVHDSEPRVEYDFEEGEAGMRVGQWVRHPQFGRGRVEGVTAWQGTVAVRFESGERRTIKATFLRPVSDAS